LLNQGNYGTLALLLLFINHINAEDISIMLKFTYKNSVLFLTLISMIMPFTLQAGEKNNFDSLPSVMAGLKFIPLKTTSQGNRPIDGQSLTHILRARMGTTCKPAIKLPSSQHIC